MILIDSIVSVDAIVFRPIQPTASISGNHV